MKTFESPFISVIIPAYNAERTVENCIKSVTAQTFHCMEIIIIDDGSTDGTYHLIRKLAADDRRIKIVRQNNQGASAARNRGIQEAKGQYIIFVDADDMIMPDMVEVLVKKQREFDADLTQCAVLCFSGKRHAHIFSDRISHRYESREDIRKHFYDILNNVLNGPVAKLYRKSVIDQNNILFDEELEVSEDLCFNLQYLEKIDSMLYIPDVLYKYYCYNSFLTKKYKKDLFAKRKKAIVILDDFIIRNGLKRDVIYYLYIKLVFAASMQEIEHHRKKKERFCEINKNIIREEVREAIGNYNPHEFGYIGKILYWIIKTENTYLIDFLSHIMVFVKKNKFIRIKRLSA